MQQRSSRSSVRYLQLQLPMKKSASFLAVLFLAALSVVTARGATTADVLFVIDESGSMSGEHAWLGTMVTSLDTQLGLAGVTGNRYGLIGFGNGLGGGANSGRTINVGGGLFGTAAQFATATGSLVTSGSTEDGYAGINFGLNNYAFRGGAAVNVILVTDEDRDNSNAALTFASTLAALNGDGALLNAVVNGSFRTSSTAVALGHDSDSNAYVANGLGGFTIGAAGSATGTGTTIADYYNLALATGGAAWDLNQLRAGGNTGVSFTKAFVDVKVQEIVVQPVPVPGTPDGGVTWLMLLGVLVVVARLRWQRAG
jgi:hypothetical protein